MRQASVTELLPDRRIATAFHRSLSPVTQDQTATMGGCTLQMERGKPVTVHSVLAAEPQERTEAHHRRQPDRAVLLIKHGF